MQEYRVIVDNDGGVRFYKPCTVELHRLDGPAVEEPNGYKAWFQNSQRHRTDGPAIEYANCDTVEYWINGKELTEAQFKKATAPAKEMTVAEIEAKLGHKVKIVK